MYKKIFVLFFIVFIFFVSGAEEFRSWEYWYGSKFLRFTFKFSNDADYKIVNLEEKRLFVIDVNSDYHKETQFFNVNKGNVESIRIGAFEKGITRIVVKLKYINEVKVYKAVNKVDEDFILFVDVDDYYAEKHLEKTSKKDIFTVTVDPGHGGFDPGAINKHFNVKEKDICLDIVKKIKWIIDKQNIDGIDVRLTRDTDIFLPLRNRTHISNTNGSDLFISVHADSSYRKTALGASVYYYSNVSSTVEAKWVAFNENNELVKEKKVAKNDINLIIGDILNSNSHKYSSYFTGIAKSELVENNIPIHGNGVFSADFTVLETSLSPAMLAEVGFLSNNTECKKLLSNKYRYDLAKALVCAIIKYYNYIKKDTDLKVEFPEVSVVRERPEGDIDEKLNYFCVNSEYLIRKVKGGETNADNN